MRTLGKPESTVKCSVRSRYFWCSTCAINQAPRISTQSARRVSRASGPLRWVPPGLLAARTQSILCDAPTAAPTIVGCSSLASGAGSRRELRSMCLQSLKQRLRDFLSARARRSGAKVGDVAPICRQSYDRSSLAMLEVERSIDMVELPAIGYGPANEASRFHPLLCTGLSGALNLSLPPDSISLVPQLVVRKWSRSGARAVLDRWPRKIRPVSRVNMSRCSAVICRSAANPRIRVMRPEGLNFGVTVPIVRDLSYKMNREALRQQQGPY